MIFKFLQILSCIAAAILFLSGCTDSSLSKTNLQTKNESSSLGDEDLFASINDADLSNTQNQTAAQVTNQYIVEGGCEYCLVSAHLGARTAQKGQPPTANHSLWQGTVYKITGSEPGYPNMLESTGYRIDPQTGQGTVTKLILYSRP